MQGLSRTGLVVVLAVGFLLSAIHLFTVYVYEPAVLSQARLHFASPTVEDPEPAGGLTVALYPEKHQQREKTTIHLDWTISKGTKAPDGVEKLVYLVNGKLDSPEHGRQSRPHEI